MNNLEEQTKSILKENKWEVLQGSFYKDPSTGLPREKDIIGTLQRLKNHEDIGLNYNAKIFIECKTMPEITEVFYSEKKSIENTILVNRIPFVSVSEMERTRSFHFYSFLEIFQQKDSKDLLYKSINQNLQSFSAYRKENEQEKDAYFFCIVFDNNIQYKDVDCNIQKLNRGIIKVRTIDGIYNLPNKSCFIELVSINHFQNYLDDIAKDLQEIDESIFFYYKKEEEKIKNNRREKLDEYY
jgi:hypothetical protein